MIKYKLIIFFILALAAIYGFFYSLDPSNDSVKAQPESNELEAPLRLAEKITDGSPFGAPMGQAKERITKKKFGDFISPETSPVQPEKFRGFHAGVDWEVFLDEINADVPVKAVCSGRLKFKSVASGYGGVAVQECSLQSEPITVVYGHMKLSSIAANKGQDIQAGETLGLLGDDKSAETDGARKHLHLAFHKGADINIKGYLETKEELSGWIDPCEYVCGF